MSESTATYEINFQEAERMSKLLEKYPSISSDELHKAMVGSVRRVTVEIQKRTPVYTTQLRRSIVGRVERSLIGQAGAEIVGSVGTDSPYALAVEFGLPAGHLPPEEPLIRWAAVVLGDGEAGKAVRWAIFHRGTKKPPRAMFAQGWREARGWVSQRFQQALAEIVKRLGNGG